VLVIGVEDLDDNTLAASEASLQDDHHLVLAEDGLPHGFLELSVSYLWQPNAKITTQQNREE